MFPFDDVIDHEHHIQVKVTLDISWARLDINGARGNIRAHLTAVYSYLSPLCITPCRVILGRALGMEGLVIMKPCHVKTSLC